MSQTDLIADAFTMVRNALMAKKQEVEIPASNTLKSILEILKTAGLSNRTRLRHAAAY